MKILLYTLSAFLILCGLGALTMPFAMLSSPSELGILSATLACLVAVISIYFVAAGFQHIRKKDKESALAVVTTSGFLVWVLLNSQMMQIAEKQEGDLWRFGALIIPILICYYGTKAFKKSIRQKYEK